jgi:steroid delta-isomerase-like uncharacterized protein
MTSKDSQVKERTDRTKENKATVQEYADAFSRGDFDTVKALCTPDVIISGVMGKGGLGIALPIWDELHRAFGIQLEIQDMIAEDDRVAVRFLEKGTFSDDFRGIQPTGKSYELVAMEWFRMEEGKIAQRWGARDFAAMMRQVAAPL